MNCINKYLPHWLVGFFAAAVFNANIAYADNHFFGKDALLNITPTLSEPVQAVELQAFINNEKAAYQGKITIVPPLNISFTAVLKVLPQKKSTGYLYTALELMQVNPLPKVEYQAFIGAPAINKQGGEVIPVYMDNQLALALAKQNAKNIIDQRLTWYGYHIYNFSRGPAIVLENVDLEQQEVAKK